MTRPTAFVLCFAVLVVAVTWLGYSYLTRVLLPPQDERSVCEQCLEQAHSQWDCGAKYNNGCGYEMKWSDPNICEGGRAAEIQQCMRICEKAPQKEELPK